MLPYRRSFLLAFFSLAVCRAASPRKDSSSTSSSFPPALIFPTPNSPVPSSPSQGFSGTSSDTLSPSLTLSSSSSSTSTVPSATPTTSSSHSLTTTSTIPSASATRPSTTSTSTSSSSSQTPSSSSSTSALPSSSSSPTSFDVAPATTLIVSDPASLTSSSDDAGPTNDVSSSSATSASFWDNKSAVAGTFVTVALASLVLVAVVAYMVFRRRQQRKLERAMEEEDFDDRRDIADPYETRGASPAPSMTQMTTPSRAEAIVSRDIHFGADYMNLAGQGTYGLDYPPGTVPLNNAGRAGWGPTYPAAGNVQHQPGVGSSVVGHLSPPSNSRQAGRASVATHFSYDSFYGGIDRGYAI